jgi:hypothetical protein
VRSASDTGARDIDASGLVCRRLGPPGKGVGPSEVVGSTKGDSQFGKGGWVRHKGNLKVPEPNAPVRTSRLQFPHP